jgi:hypothetical protein
VPVVQDDRFAMAARFAGDLGQLFLHARQSISCGKPARMSSAMTHLSLFCHVCPCTHKA